MDQETAKKAVGRAAARLVENGQRLGLGTGSTVAHFLDALAERVSKEGLEVVGVPTSERTAGQCRRLGIALTTLADEPALDLCVDGADEVAPGLQLVKGGGGALLREKVVAAASDRFVVIVDATKEVDRLGTTFCIPVEVTPYAVPLVLRALNDLAPALRRAGEAAFVTDNGNHVLDLDAGPLDDPHALASRLDGTVGVVEHGLFLDMVDLCLVAAEDGVCERDR